MSKRPWWLLPPGRVPAVWWIVPGFAVIWADYLSGPATHFPLLYAIPVILAAWYSGKWPAIALVTAITLFRLLVVLGSAGTPNDSLSRVVWTLLRSFVVLVMALWFDRLAEFERLRDRVTALEGLLPICSFCKSIRNDQGEWERFEGYISRRSTAVFSHSLCPSCGSTHYPELATPPS